MKASLMEHKLISTYTFLTGTQCNVIYVTLSCQRGPLTSFLLNTAINVALAFPGKKRQYRENCLSFYCTTHKFKQTLCCLNQVL